MDKNNTTKGTWILVAAIIIVIAICIWAITLGKLTEREGLLLSIVHWITP